MILLQAPRYKTVLPPIMRPPDDYAREGGLFGASRTGGRSHLGVDLMAPPEFHVVAPWDTKIQRSGLCYSGDSRYTLIVIEPTHLEGEYYKILYVAPIPSLIKKTVARGTVLGRVQDLAKRYPVDRDHPGGIINHIHVERWKYGNGRWERIDPTDVLFPSTRLKREMA